MVLYTLFGVPEMMDTPPIIDKLNKLLTSKRSEGGLTSGKTDKYGVSLYKRNIFWVTQVVISFSCVG